MSYDVKCQDLAEEFLVDFIVPEKTKKSVTERLAQTIQDAIEDELSSLKDENKILEKP